MPTLDVFNNGAFSMTSLTDAILKAPYVPGQVSGLGIFRDKGVQTTSIMIEEKDGRLSLLTNQPRGGVPNHSVGQAKRTARSFIPTHLPDQRQIMADSFQGVRAFGSESEVESVQNVIASDLADMRNSQMATLEFLRVGALKGVILDADGTTTIYNMFTQFGVSQQTAAWTLATDDIQAKATAVQRLIEVELGAEPVQDYVALCGDTFYDGLRANATVKAALTYQESAQLRTGLGDRKFTFGGVTWLNYRGSIGGVDFVETAKAYVMPIGPDIYRTYYAPANFIETVNTIGKSIYAKIVLDDELNRWVTLHTQSNPLPVVLRPRAIVQITGS